MKNIFFILLVNSFLSYGQTYSLSTSFGINGMVKTENTTDPWKIIKTPNNQLLSVGYIYLDSPNPNLVYHSVLARYDLNGNLDTTFGTNGVVQTNVDFQDRIYDVLVQSDGKTLSGGGYTIQSPSTGTFPTSPYLARYNVNGTLDATFGTNGLLKITNYTSLSNATVSSIALTNTNKILLGITGSNNNYYGSLCLLNMDGSFDATFGSNGFLNFNDPNFRFNLLEFNLLSDNKILICGSDRTIYTNPKTAVIKLNSDGSYDISFANNGKLILDLYDSLPVNLNEFSDKIRLSLDGNYLASGYAVNNYSIIKFNQNGQLINSFGTNGILQHNYSYGSFAVQNDSKIVIGGIKDVNGSNAFSVTRLNQNGSLDNSFNNTGNFDIDITSTSDVLREILVDNQNSIIMSGYSTLNNKYVFTHVKIVDETLNSNTFSNSEINVYPNPFSNEIYFKSKELIKKIELYNSLGNRVGLFENRGNFSKINVSLQTGLYFCKVYNYKDEVFDFKLVRN